jgi:hypothetical protein
MVDAPSIFWLLFKVAPALPPAGPPGWLLRVGTWQAGTQAGGQSYRDAAKN